MHVAGAPAGGRMSMPAPRGVWMGWVDQAAHAWPAGFTGVVCE